MTHFIIKKLPYALSSHAGLALIGQFLKSIKLKSLLDSAFLIRAGIANSDVLKSYIALLSSGKNEFDAIENFRDNDFFKRALDLRHISSSPTHEQFHSEFKTDIDLERRPSGKLDINYLECQLAAVVMNLLRMIRQNTLNGPDSPVRRTAKRRRIRTVMHEMMFKAARMI